MRKKNVCFSVTGIAFPIELTQQGRNRFTVRYGLQVKRDLTYAQAARELGECIMHARACDGAING